MSPWRLAPALALTPCIALAQDVIGLSPGIVITKSARVMTDDRLILSPGQPMTCITIKGNDITVDFGGAYVRGEKDVYHNRESFNGVGLLIDGCKNVTVKNAHIQGFRFNVRIANSDNVRLENCDVSFSRAMPMLRDGVEIDDFLNLRDNSAWRNYGAGIWIEGSKACTVDNCTGTGGLIGTALVDCTGCTIHGSDFSFNGGWGIAVSHSSDNVIAWNHLDFVNRLWGGGWGADSAALAVADDSDRNYFVGNSMTHGGDGFFLSNRNDIGPVNPKTGFYDPQGGSDHNIVAYNDGSWSPNNAFEGTFSDGNVYFDNRSNFSGFAYWLGFSTNSLLLYNTVTDNSRGGIWIEQGRGTKIQGNHMERNAVSAIHLWQSNQKERKPFPSTAIDIVDNLISDSPVAFDLDGSSDVAFRDNKLVRASTGNYSAPGRATPDAASAFKSTAEYAKLQQIKATKPEAFVLYADQKTPKGVEWLQADVYAPKDFRGDLAAVRQIDPGKLELYLLESGVKVSGPSWVDFEDTPDDPYIVRIVSKPTEGDAGEDKPVEVTLVSKDGQRKQKVSGILRTAVWDLRWYSWKGMTYDNSIGWTNLFAKTPLKTEQTRILGGDWSYRSPSAGVPADHFALVATTTIKVPPGRYLFHSVSDDGIRVFVDDRPIIDRWNHHGPTPDNVPVDLGAGTHTIRVEYCQEDGAAVLRLDWTRQP